MVDPRIPIHRWSRVVPEIYNLYSPCNTSVSMSPRDEPDLELIVEGTHNRKRTNRALDGTDSESEEIEVVKKKRTKKSKTSSNASKGQANVVTQPSQSNQSIGTQASASAAKGNGQAVPTSSNQPSVQDPIEKQASEEEDEIRSLSHHIQFKDRPDQSCTADHAAFSRSKSLVYTFLQIGDGTETYDDNGKLAACKLFCTFCKAKQQTHDGWKWGKKNQGGTGTFSTHFERYHNQKWSLALEKDNEVLNPRRNTERQASGQKTLDFGKVSQFHFIVG